MSGILASALGESPAEMQARVEEAKKNANDLTNLVRKKKVAKTEEPDVSTNGMNGSGKRKLDDDEVAEADSKKAKVEEATDPEA